MMLQSSRNRILPKTSLEMISSPETADKRPVCLHLDFGLLDRKPRNQGSPAGRVAYENCDVTCLSGMKLLHMAFLVR